MKEGNVEDNHYSIISNTLKDILKIFFDLNYNDRAIIDGTDAKVKSVTLKCVKEIGKLMKIMTTPTNQNPKSKIKHNLISTDDNLCLFFGLPAYIYLRTLLINTTTFRT